jgi:hypothetical protein
MRRAEFKQSSNDKFVQAELNRFAYKALGPKHTIRVLILEPGSFGQPVTGSIEHILDDSNCAYDALSYVWGKTKSDQLIYLKSRLPTLAKEMLISTNLYAALQRLRYPKSSRRLWVDAICINQNDMAEKSSQVEKMREIFANAQRVVVWLGEEEEHDEHAISALPRLNSHVGQFDEVDPYPKLGWGRDEEGEAWSKGTKASALTAMEVNYLEHFLRKEWFRRSWVVQEVATAREIDVQYGPKTVAWDIFNGLYHETQDMFGEDDMGSKLARRACENIATMENGRRSHHGLMSMDLFNVLLTTNTDECTDLRDKVFSMLGLAGDWLRKKGIQPDYSDSTKPEDVFKRFAVWDTKQNNKIRILSCASGPSIGKRHHLPTWVPDWTNIENPDPFVRYRDRTGFDASLNLEPRIWHSDDDNVLHVAGQFVDTVQRIGLLPAFTKVTSKFQLNKNAVRRLDGTRKWLRKCYTITAGKSGIMPPATFGVFAKTMICGLNGGGFPASSNYILHFSQYFDFMMRAPEVFLEYINDARHKGITALDEFYPEFQGHRLIDLSLQNWSSRRRFCRTKCQRIGFVPKVAQAGDIICVLYGGEVPYVLRPRKDGCYSVIGECYIHGIMHGEALSDGGTRTKEFKLR